MRYIILLILNLPIILLALANTVTRYKMNETSKPKFIRQLLTWFTILIVVAGSFPVYNILTGKPFLDSTELSSFDIVQTTVIIGLLYIINDQRHGISQLEKRFRLLHEDLSIKLSGK